MDNLLNEKIKSFILDGLDEQPIAASLRNYRLLDDLAGLASFASDQAQLDERIRLIILSK